MKLIDADAIHYHQMWEEDWTKQTIYFGHGVPEWEIDEMPTVDAIPIQYILTTIREWNRDGYAESAEALEILVMNWDKENSECVEREEE